MMTNPTEVHLSFPSNDPPKEPLHEEMHTKENGKGCSQCLFVCETILIVFLVLLIGILTGVMFILSSHHKKLQIKINQLLNDTLQEKTQPDPPVNTTVQGKTQPDLFLNATVQGKTQPDLLLNATVQGKTQPDLLLNECLQEKTQLDLLLNETLQDKAQLVNEHLNKVLDSTQENENRLKEKIKQLEQLLSSEQQTSVQHEAERKHQRSILFSDKLSFLWKFCNKETLQCSRCLPGWTEHASRCFFLPSNQAEWEDARRQCNNEGGDLAVVLNAADQAFLTNMTYQFHQQHPGEQLHSAWIGLQDMIREGVFVWISGEKLDPSVGYWRPGEPNNSEAPWDKDRSGQDCVAIIPPGAIGPKSWLNTWDDITCLGVRHYICETKALILD